MTIKITTSRHTRKEGSNVRVVTFDTKQEHNAVCSSNVTTEATASGGIKGWGDWDLFKKNMEKTGYQVDGE